MVCVSGRTAGRLICPQGRERWRLRSSDPRGVRAGEDCLPEAAQGLQPDGGSVREPPGRGQRAQGQGGRHNG